MSLTHMALVLASSSLAPGPPEPCEPAALAMGTDQLPDTWRSALEELVEATRDPDKPWGCPEASVDLEIRGDHAVLRIERAGQPVVERAALTPSDVAPLGKLLLTRAPRGPEVSPTPPPAAEPPAQVPSASSANARVGADVVPDEPRSELTVPRAFVEGTASTRYLGGTDAMTAGGGVRGALPVDAFSISLWGRYSALLAALDTVPDGFGLSEMALGAGADYRIVDAPVMTSVGLTGGAAIVQMSGSEQQPDGENNDSNGAAVDFRLGTEARLWIPIASAFSMVIALDADFAPSAIENPNDRIDPLLPHTPSYTVGLSAGLGAAVR